MTMQEIKKDLEKYLGKIAKVVVENGSERTHYVGVVTHKVVTVSNISKEVVSTDDFVLFTTHGDIIDFKNLFFRFFPSDNTSLKITTGRNITKEERDIVKDYHNKVKKIYKMTKESSELFNLTKENIETLKKINKIYSCKEFCLNLLKKSNRLKDCEELSVKLNNDYEMRISETKGKIIHLNLFISKDIGKYASASFIGEDGDSYGSYKYIKYSSLEYLESLKFYENKYKDNKILNVFKEKFNLREETSSLQLGDKDWLTYDHFITLIPKKEMLLNDNSLEMFLSLLNS